MSNKQRTFKELGITTENPQIVFVGWLNAALQDERWRAYIRARVIRVTDCAAVLLVNQPVREFKTRFDKPVRFQPPPARVRISANAEIEILYRSSSKPSPRKRADRQQG